MSDNEQNEKIDEKELRTWLELEFFEKLEKVKKYYGLRNTTEIIRFLINKEFRDLFGDQKEKKSNK